MKHIHLNTISSTQSYLKDNIDALLSDEKEILVSAEQQTDGKGRTGKEWDHFKNGVALSFTLKPCEVLTLTSLEMGVIISNFIEHFFKREIQLKWPNDIMLKNKRKCGGIICDYYRSDLIIVGIGVNLGRLEDNVSCYKYDMPVDCVRETLDLTKDDKKRLSFEMFDYITKNRVHTSLLRNEWLKKCIHTNKEVRINNGTIEKTGCFVGIDETGQALLKSINGNVNSFLSGGLSF